MVTEWAGISGGRISAAREGRKWVRLSDDPWTIGDRRSPGSASDVAAVFNHANARARASGYRKDIIGNAPDGSYMCAVTRLDDAPAVLLAILDRQLSGADEIATWYMASVCAPRHCLYHAPDADLRNPRTPTPPGPVQWPRIPAPQWLPGTGAVEETDAIRAMTQDGSPTRHTGLVRPPTPPFL
ncbi:hypothetical protein [Murinocardiopsis flavida]|nr:hypothetical protein [Murinocardiopsis flavida]